MNKDAYLATAIFASVMLSGSMEAYSQSLPNVRRGDVPARIPDQSNTYNKRSSDDTVRIGNYRAYCLINRKIPVFISLYSSREKTGYIAVQGASGPEIMVNAFYVDENPVDSQLFDFYRECALHQLDVVKATSINPIPEYDMEVLQKADCVAAHATKKQMAVSGEKPNFYRIASLSKATYGNMYRISRTELEKCAEIER